RGGRAELQVRGLAPYDPGLLNGGVVELRVGQRDPANPVVAQPTAILPARQVAVVEDAISQQVGLPQPATREREPRRQVGGLPVVEGVGNLDPLALGALLGKPPLQWLVVRLRGGGV